MNKQQYLAEKAKLAPSVQSRFDTKQVDAYFSILMDFCGKADSLGTVGSESRDAKIRFVWQNEPILAGVMYTQQARLAAMHWTVKGPEEEAQAYTQTFQNLGYGTGFDTEIKKWAQDYLSQSRGAMWEKGRESKNGPVVGLAHMDMARCHLQPDPLFPATYTRNDGREVPLRREDIIHRCSMPSPAEEAWGAGCCLVDRAMRAVQLLMALHKYEESALDDMPPDGIAAVTGMDWATLERAMGLWKQRRDSKDLTFRRILWLCGNPMSTQAVKVEWSPFAEPPKDFNRREVIETYIKTLAADAGEDPNEFWLFVHSGATKGAVGLLHEKGQGKGVVEMATCIERAFNWEVLPPGLAFAFDYRDRTAQKIELQRQEGAINNALNLWKIPPGMMTGLITSEVALELLVKHEVITTDQARRIGVAMPNIQKVPDTNVGTDTEGIVEQDSAKELHVLLRDKLSDIDHKLAQLEKEDEDE